MQLRLPQVPKGRYQIDHSIYMNGAYGSTTTPTVAFCYVVSNGDGGPYRAYSSTTAEGHNVGLSASDVVVKTAHPLELSCQAHAPDVGPDDWQISSLIPTRVTLTRIDKAIGRRLSTDSNSSSSSRLDRR